MLQRGYIDQIVSQIEDEEVSPQPWLGWNCLAASPRPCRWSHQGAKEAWPCAGQVGTKAGTLCGIWACPAKGGL